MDKKTKILERRRKRQMTSLVVFGVILLGEFEQPRARHTRRGGQGLRRIKAGVYENDEWYVERKAEDDDGEVGLHPITGYQYTPAAVFSWFLYNKKSGDLHDAYPTLREARRVATRATYVLENFS